MRRGLAASSIRHAMAKLSPSRRRAALSEAGREPPKEPRPHHPTAPTNPGRPQPLAAGARRCVGRRYAAEAP